jgi:hypothetical protein
MNRDHVIAVLRTHAETIRGFGVTALYLYGSTARDEDETASDIDLFADVDYDRFSFVPFMELRDFLRSILHREVDFTTRTALHPDLKRAILDSAVKIFDEKQIDIIAAQ